MNVVRVIEVINPAESSLEGAHAIVRRALDIQVAGRVRIDFTGFRGGSSSLFNAILHGLRAALGDQAVRNGVEFIFDTAAQRSIFERSKDATLKASA